MNLVAWMVMTVMGALLSIKREINSLWAHTKVQEIQLSEVEKLRNGLMAELYKYVSTDLSCRFSRSLR